MDNRDLEIRSPLRAENLNPNQYTLSLLQEAGRAGVIGPAELGGLQGQLLSTLNNCIIRFTKGESSSVREETARGLFLSVLYCLDAYLLDQSPDQAVSLLTTTGVEAVYVASLDYIQQQIRTGKTRLAEVTKHKLNVELVAYHDTIGVALPAFFVDYDPIFGAQETMAGIDYPLACEITGKKGIAYILQYLERLQWENRFCHLFARDEITRVLHSCGRINQTDYRELLINIFEICFANAVFSGLLGNRPDRLSIPDSELKTLDQQLAPLSEGTIRSLFSQAVDSIILTLDGQAEIVPYLRQYQALLEAKFLVLREQGNWHSLVVTDGEGVQPATVLEPGQKMADASFRNIVSRVLECHTATEKAALVLSSVQSLEDFIDILQADCLFGEEYNLVFSQLGDRELSVLASIVFADELRNVSVLTDRELSGNETEIEWQKHFIEYLQGSGADRLEAVGKMAGSFMVRSS